MSLHGVRSFLCVLGAPALVAVLLTGCGGGSSTSSSGASGSPQKGGSITFAWQSEPTTLDPAIAWNLLDWQIEHNVFQSLYGYEPKSGEAGTRLIPELAAAMPEVSNGGKTYTIRIREGVKFQPPVSREVTAEDFKYSFERMMKLPLAPGTYFYTAVVGASDYMAGKAAHISGFKVVDPLTLQIDLVSPDLAFLNALGMEFCDVVAKEWVDKWGATQIGRHPLGTGPFMFDHWTPGQEILLKRNPNYWVVDRPYLDEVKFALSLSPQTAYLRLKLGEVDILGDNLPPSEVMRTLADPTWKSNVFSTPMVGTIYLFLNTQMKPLDNVKVRQAISWAIDREKLVKLLGGQGEALYQLYPPGMPGHVESKQWYGYDPAKAQQLLSEAGFPNGFSTMLYSDNVDPNPKLLQSIQADLAEVGIKADIKLMSNATYYSFTSTPDSATVGTALWYMDFPDPYDWMTLFNKSGAVEGGMNNSFWWSQNVEDLIAEAQAMTDAQARIAKYEEVQAAIMEQAPYVTLYSPLTTTMFSKSVGGFYYSLVYGYDPVNYWRN